MVWQRTMVYGNQLAMSMRRYTSLGLVLALCLVSFWGCCGSKLPPVEPPGVSLQPGRYLTAYYRAPDFHPAQATYVLTPFPVDSAQGYDASTFQTLFMQELAQAWQANGLKISPQGNTDVKGVIQSVAVCGRAIRFIRGKIEASLVVSASISRGNKTLFACQDQISMSSPVNPGPSAPKEDELLLRHAARIFAVHLLNELLLYWPPAEGK